MGAIVSSAFEEVKKIDIVNESIDKVEKETGVNLNDSLEGVLNNDITQVTGSVIQGTEKEYKLINYNDDKFNLTNDESIDFLCPLTSDNESPNMLLSILQSLFFNNDDRNSNSYKVRSYICKSLFNLHYLYFTATGIVVSPSFLLESSTRSIKNLMNMLNDVNREFFDVDIFSDSLVNVMNYQLISGAIASFYPVFAFLIGILTGKTVYNRFLKLN
jgi:hypothetical protein